MKAINILEWICKNSVNGEDLNILDVPKQGSEVGEQNEDWWLRMFGFAPEQPLAEGKYLYYYATQVGVTNDEPEPDGRIDIYNVDNMFGDDYVFLIKIED